MLLHCLTVVRSLDVALSDFFFLNYLTFLSEVQSVVLSGGDTV